MNECSWEEFLQEQTELFLIILNILKVRNTGQIQTCSIQTASSTTKMKLLLQKLSFPLDMVSIFRVPQLRRMLKGPGLKSLDLHLSIIKCNCWTYDDNIGPIKNSQPL